MPEIQFGYKAIKPIRAEHPIGSGIIVDYEPGDEVPAGDWERAAAALVENGKIMRYAKNVYAPGEYGSDTAPVETEGARDDDAAPSDPPSPDWPGAEEEVTEYPVNQGKGWYLLSNGERSHGKKKALEAQAALDAEGDK